MKGKVQMRRTWMKKLILLMLLVCMPLLAGAESYAAWLPYWKGMSPMEDAQALADKLDTVIAFAAVFDQKGKPVLHEGVEKLLLKARETFAGKDTKVYLSVVNDQQNGRGYDSKTKDLLEALLKNDRTIDAHMDDLLLILDQSEADGLELDYENLGSNKKLYERYAQLIEKLYEVLSRDGLGLRVVMSWRAPQYVTLPEGPEYSVMCYNLYGYHSGPGPKADINYLQQAAELWRDVPGTVRMALSTGGFLWKGGKVELALTQQEAEALLAERGIVPERNETSGALTASFLHEGRKAVLWYADGETLRLWQTELTEFDGIDIFCLGGSNVRDWLSTFLQSDEAAEEER